MLYDKPTVSSYDETTQHTAAAELAEKMESSFICEDASNKKQQDWSPSTYTAQPGTLNDMFIRAIDRPIPLVLPHEQVCLRRSCGSVYELTSEGVLDTGWRAGVQIEVR